MRIIVYTTARVIALPLLNILPSNIALGTLQQDVPSQTIGYPSSIVRRFYSKPTGPVIGIDAPNNQSNQPEDMNHSSLISPRGFEGAHTATADVDEETIHQMIRFAVIIFCYLMGIATLSVVVAPKRPNDALPAIQGDAYPITVAQVAVSMFTVFFDIVPTKENSASLRRKMASCHLIL
ncbi:uncharacterized protein F4822DRAFT_310280 [Hypoxylon trugodes]|uniref:uncharacterized protein n=1 Tax=Hypoxylon trugodes TaxID=326681 RepID=UPI0021A1F3F1|nr:uncharacterized protein F4822DRAFT_310280 [Hypoxylon trugodes]KAI1386246.1 hypothetical protein F4822DRAFT_310280 [Hypoxylon trugodes]